MARIVAQKLSEIWARRCCGKPRRRNGAIGIEFAARQPADGSSFVIGNLGRWRSARCSARCRTNMNRDFAPVTLAAAGVVLVVNVVTPANNLSDAGPRPATSGQHQYASAGQRQLGHLGGG